MNDTMANENASSTSFIKMLSIKIYGFLHKLVNTVVVKKDGYTELTTAGSNNTLSVDKDVSKISEKDGVDSLGETTEVQDNKTETCGGLFPSQIVVDKSLNDKSSAVPCSLDVTNSYENMGIPVNIPVNMNMNMNMDLMRNNTMHTMNSFTPNPSPPDSVLKQGHLTSKHSQVTTGVSSESLNGVATSEKEEDEQGGRPEVLGCEEDEENVHPRLYVCHYCDAQFTVRGYLTRHIKKHAVEKAYRCPFYDVNVDQSLRCHATGGFSRRDTYKTHLKTRHFILPKEVLPKFKLKCPGNCGLCGEYFENSEVWCETHIATGACIKLPPGFTSFPRTTTQHKHSQFTLKMIKYENGVARYISSKESIMEPKVFANREAVDIMAELAQDSLLSPSSQHNMSVNATQHNTPGNMSSSTYSQSPSTDGLHMNGGYTPIIEKLSDNRIVIHSENIEGLKETKKKKGKNKATKNLDSKVAKISKKLAAVASKKNKVGKLSLNNNGSTDINDLSSPKSLSSPFQNSNGINATDTSSAEGPSSADDSGLEPVKSNSSQSSNESLRRFLVNNNSNNNNNTGTTSAHDIPQNTSRPHLQTHHSNDSHISITEQLLATKENLQHIQSFIPQMNTYTAHANINQQQKSYSPYQSHPANMYNNNAHPADDFPSLDSEQQTVPHQTPTSQYNNHYHHHHHHQQNLLNKNLYKGAVFAGNTNMPFNYASPVSSSGTPVQSYYTLQQMQHLQQLQQFQLQQQQQQQQMQQYPSLDQGHASASNSSTAYNSDYNSVGKNPTGVTGHHMENVNISINNTLSSTVNDQIGLSEKQSRETEQYRKFYEFTFQQPSQTEAKQ